MIRREFLQTSAAVVTGAITTDMNNHPVKGPLLDKVGIQLFSLPKTLEKDFAEGMSMLSTMGYKDIELYGPYTFSHETSKSGWKTITPMLGFSGSGFYGHDAKGIRDIFNNFGLKTSSVHADLISLEHHMDRFGEAAAVLGFEYVVIPTTPEEQRQSIDGYKKLADLFNRIGASAKKVGLKFGYHNHGYGLKEVDGQIPLQVLLDATDPELVFLELDIYWTTAGGADPIDYLKKYPNRYKLMHLKDMKEKVRFQGDGGNPSEWMALFPFMTTVGDGVLDIDGIVQAGKENGVEHFYVEQDLVANPETALQDSINYLISA